VVLLDDVIDVGHRGADEECEDERDDVVLAAPDVDIDSVDDSEEGEAPADAVDDDTVSSREELVDDESEEEEVYQRPETESPRSRSEVGFLTAVVDALGRSDGVNVRT